MDAPDLTDHYKDLKILRRSPRSEVYEAISKRGKGKKYCILRVFTPFETLQESFHALREVYVYVHLRKHPGINRLHRALLTKADQPDLLLVMHHMEANLQQVIRAHILEPIHKKYIVYQLLDTLHYLEQAQLLHRGLTPTAILISSECTVRLSSWDRAHPPGSGSRLAEGFSGWQWYRNPEELLGAPYVSPTCDIWSLGCVFAEMLRESPLFPGTSMMNSLERILELTGLPTEQDLVAINSPYARGLIDSMPSLQTLPFESRFTICDDESQHKAGSVSAEGMSLLKKMLRLNPVRRPSAIRLLRHPYLSQFFDEKDLLKYKGPSFVDLLRASDDQSKESNRQRCEKIMRDFNEKQKSRKQRRAARIRTANQLHADATSLMSLLPQDLLKYLILPLLGEGKMVDDE